MSKFNCIRTERLLIRTLEMRDKEVFYKYRTLPEIYEYQSWIPKDIDEIESFILKNNSVNPDTANTWMQLAICLQDDTLIGDIGIHFLDDGYQVEIGYTLVPDFQGNGYALEAVIAIMTYLFSALNKHRIAASVDPRNTKSIKLLEKLGFRKEAHLIKSFRMNDQWYDDCVYAILAEEWNNRNC